MYFLTDSNLHYRSSSVHCRNSQKELFSCFTRVLIRPCSHIMPTDLLTYSDVWGLPQICIWCIWCGRVFRTKLLNCTEYLASEVFGFPASLSSLNIFCLTCKIYSPFTQPVFRLSLKQGNWWATSIMILSVRGPSWSYGFFFRLRALKMAVWDQTKRRLVYSSKNKICLLSKISKIYIRKSI